MAIYSIIPFLNEFHFLDLKIEEEIKFVDKFIIIESNQRYNGKHKELLLKNNPKYQSDRFEIICLENKFTEYDESDDPQEKSDKAWANEEIQRNSAMRDFDDKDIILYSDCDEIFRRQDIPEIFNKTLEIEKRYNFSRICQLQYVTKINLLFNADEYWYGPSCITGRTLKELVVFYSKEKRKAKLDFNLLRRFGYGEKIVFGKNFNYVMSPEKISYKLQSFSHTELDRPEITDLNEILKKINSKKDVIRRRDVNGFPISLEKVPIDESYPIGILENMEFWKQFVA